MAIASLLGGGGRYYFQLLGVILQYNRMVETLATQGHLAVMKGLVKLAEQQIRQVHDRAEVA
jgi:hypothetical protein